MKVSIISLICPLCFLECEQDKNRPPQHCGVYMIEKDIFLADAAGWLAQREHALKQKED